MYKNRLQELCQKNYWAMPRYTANKVGPDHNPRFTASVVVNGATFETTQFFKSSKEAQGDAARLAFESFTMPEDPPLQAPSSSAGVASSEGSSSARSEVNETAIPIGMVEAEREEALVNFPSNEAISSATKDIELKDLGMPHLCKSQLQSYAQRKNIQLPVYSCTREGPSHAIRFKATVTVDGQTFESQDFFQTVKEAEHAAAKAALSSLSRGVQEDENRLYKTMLQEFTAKEGFSLPIYKTISSGSSHMPTFFSTVEVDGEIFSGKAAKTKKLAEMNAAKVALSKLNECKSNWMQESAGHNSFFRSCVFVDLPPKLTPQTNYGPTSSFSSQSPTETAGRSNQSLPSLHCQAEEAYQCIASSTSRVISECLNVGNLSLSNEMSETGTNDDDEENSGDTQDNASFQILNNDKVRIHNLVPSTGKAYADAVPQNIDLPGLSTTVTSKKSDIIYPYLRDGAEDGMSSSSTQSDCPDASDLSAVIPGRESGPSLLVNKIRVYPHEENMTLPKGATVLPFSDDEWIAAKLELPEGEGTS